MPAHRPPPPLTRWGEGWRLGVAIVVGLLLFVGERIDEPTPAPLFSLLDLVVGAAAIVALHWRRRWPPWIALATTAATTVSVTAVMASVIAFVSLATTRRWWPILLVSVVSLPASYGYEALQPSGQAFSPWWSLLLFTGLVTAVMVGFGAYVGARRDLHRERTEAAEREWTARVEQARLGERARIAREMHDVLAHRISLVCLHAGAMTYRTDLGAGELRASARIVQDNAQRALVDLRDVLGVLRDPPAPTGDDDLATPAPPATPPQPTLAGLPELVREAGEAGTPVRVVGALPDDLAAAPDTVGRTAYRIVQEALTNARKHAPGTPVALRLTGRPGTQLEVEVRNPMPRTPVPVGGSGPAGPVPGAGLGLVGLAERAELAGGSLVHGTTADQEYRVLARLPWPA